jgi:hypothetical protein
MKYLKLFEGWSDQYLHDFTDEEKFTVEEDGKKVKGEYKGSFDTVDMTNLFADAVSKISSDYKILKAQSFFNQVTGNAKFEIEVQNYEGEFIEIETPGGKLKWTPEKVVNLWSEIRTRVCQWIHIEGRLENGAKRTVMISFHRGDTQSPNLQYATTTDNLKMKVTIGGRYRGVSIDKENISKLIEIIRENKIDQQVWSLVPHPNYPPNENSRLLMVICLETLSLFNESR